MEMKLINQLRVTKIETGENSSRILNMNLFTRLSVQPLEEHRFVRQLSRCPLESFHSQTTSNEISFNAASPQRNAPVHYNSYRACFVDLPTERDIFLSFPRRKLLFVRFIGPVIQIHITAKSKCFNPYHMLQIDKKS